MGVFPQSYYMATGGTVSIMSVSPRIVGAMTQMSFEHVYIEGETLRSVPVGDGCVSGLEHVSFDELVQNSGSR
jgi:hypothetical protein